MRTLIGLLAVLVMTTTLHAQGMGRTGGQMGQHRQFYDPNAVTTITGTITSVDSVSFRNGNTYSIRFTLQDSTGAITVMVGPSFYLDQQNIHFSKGNKVEVTGAKMHFNENDVIMAAQIKIGSKTLKLRDDTGRPVWARRGMR